MFPKKSKKDEDGKPGLSIKLTPEMQAAYEEAAEKALGKHPIFESEDNPMVTKFSYDKMEEELKGKIKDLQDKLEETRKDRDQARTERDSWKTKYEGLSAEKENIESSLSKTKAELESVKGDNARLAKENKENYDVTSSLEYRGLQSNYEDLEKRNGKLEGEIEGLRGEADGLRQQIGDLEQQLKEAFERVPEPVQEEEQSDGTIVWSDGTKFRSDLFTCQKYRVTLDRKGKYISFTPDVEGRCVCEDNTIEIPSIGRFIPSKDGTYSARLSGDTIMMYI